MATLWEGLAMSCSSGPMPLSHGAYIWSFLHDELDVHADIAEREMAHIFHCG